MKDVPLEEFLFLFAFNLTKPVSCAPLRHTSPRSRADCGDPNTLFSFYVSEYNIRFLISPGPFKWNLVAKEGLLCPWPCGPECVWDVQVCFWTNSLLAGKTRSTASSLLPWWSHRRVNKCDKSDGAEGPPINVEEIASCCVFLFFFII